MRRWARLVVVAVVLPLAAGCLGGGQAAPPTVKVLPASGVLGESWHLRISGAQPGATVTVTVRSDDAAGVTWESSARYRADPAGVVDTATAPSESGTYSGRHAAGLLWSMRAAPPHDATGGYFWNGAAPSTFTLSVQADGARLVTQHFRRRLAASPLLVANPKLADAGFVGRYVTPRRGRVEHPAVLLIGGSEGGLPSLLLTAALAGNGYPTLGVAYYKAPGLPPQLRDIPIETFVRALRWLRRQPGVDGKVNVIGLSRGSEAAQLLAVHDRADVRGVVAAVPADVAICSYPGCRGPAWTWNGRPVPYTRQFDEPAPTDSPDAVIPLERAKVPVLLVCGGKDIVWTSCAYAHAIVSRLHRHGGAPVALSECPAAGHSVGGLVPDEPQHGLSAEDQEARLAFWPRLLGFLARGVAPPNGSAACHP